MQKFWCDRGETISNMFLGETGPSRRAPILMAIAVSDWRAISPLIQQRRGGERVFWIRAVLRIWDPLIIAPRRAATIKIPDRARSRSPSLGYFSEYPAVDITIDSGT